MLHLKSILIEDAVFLEKELWHLQQGTETANNMQNSPLKLILDVTFYSNNWMKNVSFRSKTLQKN